jgi:hypothetical protein
VTTLPGENPFRQLTSADLESGKYASLTQIPFSSHTLVVPDSDHTALVKQQNPDSRQTRLMRKTATNRILFSFWHSPTVGQHVQRTRDYGRRNQIATELRRADSAWNALGQAGDALFSKPKKAPKNKRKSSKMGLQ